MDDKEKNFFDPNIPLTLNKEIVSSSDIPSILHSEIDSSLNINDVMLNIKDLINIKYLTIKKRSPLEVKTFLDKDFIAIKNSAKKINNDIKEKRLLINNTIENQKNELNLLYLEKKLLDQNTIQSDIISNQQELIQNYKKDTNELKVDLNKAKKQLTENINSNKDLVINNNEFKNTINHYIQNNKKLQDNITKIKNDHVQNPLSPEQINEMNDKIKFYQEENIRLSSELILVQNNYTTIKNNFSKVELEKNNIYKKIQELNNSLIKNNVVGTPFVKEIIKEDSINSKVLNDISNNNLQENKKKSELTSDIDDEINDIFS